MDVQGILLTSTHAVDYRSLREDYQFAMITATEGGTHVGARSAEHVRGCTAAHIPYGLVHYARPDLRFDASREWRHMVSTCALALPALGWWLDWEERPTGGSGRRGCPYPQVWVSEWYTAYQTHWGVDAPLQIYSAPTYIRDRVTPPSVNRLWYAGPDSLMQAMSGNGWTIAVRQDPTKQTHPAVSRDFCREWITCEDYWDIVQSRCGY